MAGVNETAETFTFSLVHLLSWLVTLGPAVPGNATSGPLLLLTN